MILVSFFAILLTGSISLSTRRESNTCPEVTFTCTALDLQSSALRWFLDGDGVAVYTLSPSHKYPRSVEPEYRKSWGDVAVQILMATINDNGFSFWSTIAVNISVLKMAEISSISCGPFRVSMRRSANIKYNTSLG